MAVDQRGGQAAELRPPLVERGVADAVLTAKLRDREPSSTCLKTAIIWLSVERDVFMQNFQNSEFEKFIFKRDRLPQGLPCVLDELRRVSYHLDIEKIIN